MLTHLRLRIDLVNLVNFANLDNSNKDVYCYSYNYSSNTNCSNKHLNEIKNKMKTLIEINFVKTILENCINYVFQYVKLID